MFDGRDYNHSFNEAVKALEVDNRKRTIEVELRSIEWVFYEGIRGVFFYVSCSLVAIFLVILQLLVDFSEFQLILRIFIVVFAVLCGIVFYFMQKMIFWFEIGRHVSPRKFGEFTKHDDPTLPPLEE